MRCGFDARMGNGPISSTRNNVDLEAAVNQMAVSRNISALSSSRVMRCRTLLPSTYNRRRAGAKDVLAPLPSLQIQNNSIQLIFEDANLARVFMQCTGAEAQPCTIGRSSLLHTLKRISLLTA